MNYLNAARSRCCTIVVSAICFAVSSTAQIWDARHGLSPAAYQSTFNDLTSKGFRLVAVSGYTSGGAERYAALFMKTSGGAWVARHGLSAASYQANFNYYTSLGYRLTWISGYEVAGERSEERRVGKE